MSRLAFVIVLLAGCASPGAQSSELSDRELAWCLRSPGAVGAVAVDNGVEEPAAARDVADDGIYDNAGRWAYYEAWDPDTYARFCSMAYVQFGGAKDEVDLAILEPVAKLPSPSPTGNIATGDLHELAATLIPQMEAAGVAMVHAVESGDVAAMKTTANELSAITDPQMEALEDAVAEPCYVEAGAAFGTTLSNWNLAASNVERYVAEGDTLNLEIALDFAADAVDTAEEWRHLDATAC